VPAQILPSLSDVTSPGVMPNLGRKHVRGRIGRIVVDECLGPASPLLAQLTQQIGNQPIEIVHVAARHPGIPDIELLNKLLDEHTALLTRDRVLHNLAIGRGLRSFIPGPTGSLSDRKVPGVPGKIKLQPFPSGALRESYLPEPDAEVQAIAGCLTGFLSGQQLKKFRTKRRRIRAHFGSFDNIAATAITVGQIRTGRDFVGGCELKVDARHGVTSLSPASESYFLDCSPRHEPLHCVVWALAQLFVLQLQSRPMTLFVCDAAVVRQCTDLVSGHPAGSSPAARATDRLLRAICEARVQGCVKGRFFDRMTVKLHQLARGDSNELVSINMEAVTRALAKMPANADKLQPR
jgi:hypothetical protein